MPRICVTRALKNARAVNDFLDCNGPPEVERLGPIAFGIFTH
jgi:hypothetical protein